MWDGALGGCSLERRVVGFGEPAVIVEIRSLLLVNYATDLNILPNVEESLFVLWPGISTKTKGRKRLADITGIWKSSVNA